MLVCNQYFVAEALFRFGLVAASKTTHLLISAFQEFLEVHMCPDTNSLNEMSERAAQQFVCIFGVISMCCILYVVLWLFENVIFWVLKKHKQRKIKRSEDNR